MKKLSIASIIVIIAFTFSYCHSSKKAAASTASNVTYEANIAPIVMASCAPCHIPAKGGNKEAYDNYANVKKDIADILHRIQLNQGERGFMPMRHPKLGADTIAVFQKWNEQGLAEK